MKLAESAVTAKVSAMRDLLNGGSLELFVDRTLIATLPIGQGTVSGDALRFGPMGPATARATGSPTAYRVLAAGGELVFEGDAPFELTVEPSYLIEKGAAVTIAEIVYREPIG